MDTLFVDLREVGAAGGQQPVAKRRQHLRRRWQRPKIFGPRPEDFDTILQRSKTPFHAFYQPLAKKILLMTRWITGWPTSLC